MTATSWMGASCFLATAALAKCLLMKSAAHAGSPVEGPWNLARPEDFLPYLRVRPLSCPVNRKFVRPLSHARNATCNSKKPCSIVVVSGMKRRDVTPE